MRDLRVRPQWKNTQVGSGCTLAYCYFGADFTEPKVTPIQLLVADIIYKNKWGI